MNRTAEIKIRWERLKVEATRLSQGRDVRIIAVSKNQSIEILKDAYEAGIREFGENKAQEVRDKSEIFSRKEVFLSFIGRLQENKIKYLLPHCTLIQSVDSMKLLSAVDSAFGREGKKIDVLLQVNSSYEGSKAGFKPEEALNAWKEALKFGNIRLRGLMTIGAHEDDESAIEKSFMITYEIYRDISEKYGNADTLSMGMSDDYAIALRCGSNMIRVGRAVFDGANIG